MGQPEVQQGGYLRAAYFDRDISVGEVDIFRTAIGVHALKMAISRGFNGLVGHKGGIQKLIREGFAHSEDGRTRNGEEGFAVEVIVPPPEAVLFMDGEHLSRFTHVWGHRVLTAAQVDVFTDLARGDNHPGTAIMYFPHGRAECIDGPSSGDPLILEIQPQARDFRDRSPIIAIPLSLVCRLESDQGKTLYVPNHWSLRDAPRPGQLVDPVAAVS